MNQKKKCFKSSFTESHKSHFYLTLLVAMKNAVIIIIIYISAFCCNLLSFLLLFWMIFLCFSCLTFHAYLIENMLKSKMKFHLKLNSFKVLLMVWLKIKDAIFLLFLFMFFFNFLNGNGKGKRIFLMNLKLLWLILKLI